MSPDFVLYGATAACHDYHTADGDFAATCVRLGTARADGHAITVVTPLTRSNYRVLVELPPQLCALGVSSWRIAIARGAVLPADQRAAWIPRLAMAIPFALHALTRARQLGLGAIVDGAPLCLLGPHRALAVPAHGDHVAPACLGCALRAGCAGLDTDYLARFGAGELTAQ